MGDFSFGVAAFIFWGKPEVGAPFYPGEKFFKGDGRLQIPGEWEGTIVGPMDRNALFWELVLGPHVLRRRTELGFVGHEGREICFEGPFKESEEIVYKFFSRRPGRRK